MFLGHYATALVPYEKTRKTPHKAPFWLFLFAAQFLDLLMVVLVPLGLEKFEPHNFLDATFATMQTDMLYSHDLVPVLFWGTGIAALGFAFTRKSVVALWCFGLVIFHEVCDLTVGFKHNVMGHDTPAVGTNLYQEAPVLGLFIEMALCAGIIMWFVRTRAKAGEPVSKLLHAGLYMVLVGGTLATLPMATTPLRSLLGGG